MKLTKWLPIVILLIPLVSQADFWSKTIVEDRGHSDKSKVESKKICDEVVIAELALLKRYDPEFEGNIKVKSHAPLEVYRTDGSYGFAAKCILDIQSKLNPRELKIPSPKTAPGLKEAEESLSDDPKVIDE